MATLGLRFNVISRGARDAERDLDRLGGAAGATGGKLKGLATAAAGAFAGFAVGGFLKDSIGAASDLNEAGTKLSAIFGTAAGDVQSFAAQGAKALGQTRLAVLDSAATFGTFGKAAGLSGTDLAKFSTGFAGLATDLASFNNTTPEQAVEAIGAALRGEAEPIRSYGVLLDDATLRQEALRLGLIKTTKQALTPQQKVLAAQAAIYKQTKDAQGDFARTSGGLANQQRILAAQVSDLKAKIGAALLPVVTKMAVVINEKLVPGLKKAVAFVRENATAFKIAGVVVGGLAASLLAYTTTVKVVTGVTKAFAAAQALLNGTLLLNPIGLVVAGAVALGVGLVVAYKKSEKFRAVVDKVGRVLREKVLPVLQRIASFVKEKVAPIVETIIRKFIAFELALAKAYLAVARFIAQTVGKLIEFGTKVAGFVTGAVGKFTELVSGVKGKVTETVGVVAGLPGRAINALKDLGSRLFNKATTAFGDFLRAEKEGLIKIVSFLAGLPGRLVGALASLGSRLFAKAKAGFGELISAAREKITGKGGLVEFVKGIPGKVVSAIGDLGSTLFEAGKSLIAGLIRGIKEAAANIPAQIGNFVLDQLNRVPGFKQLGGLTGLADSRAGGAGGPAPSTGGAGSGTWTRPRLVGAGSLRGMDAAGMQPATSGQVGRLIAVLERIERNTADTGPMVARSITGEVRGGRLKASTAIAGTRW